MAAKHGTSKKASLVGVKLLMAGLSVAGTLGLWQALVEEPAPAQSTPNATVLQQNPGRSFSGAKPSISPGASRPRTDVPVKIIVPGAQKPAPLVVTRSS